MTAATIVKMTYGHEILTNDDSYIKLAIDAIGDALKLGVTGLTPVDLFPICR